MSIGSVIKRVASAPIKGLEAVGGGLAEALTGGQQPAPAEPGIPAYTPPEYRPMDLPEIDPNDPDAEEKAKVHEYIRALESAHMEQAKMSGKDYHDQFQQMVDYVHKKPEAKRFSPLSAFMIGMGDQKNLEKVASTNAAADKEKAAREDYILGLREAAMRGNLQKLMEAGNFKKVLTESAALQELHAAQARIRADREHKQKLEQIQETNRGRVDVANINADKVIRSAEIRARSYGENLGLKKELIKSKTAMAVATMRGIMASKDMMGQANWDPKAVEAVHQALEDELEALADDPANLETAPSTSPPAAAPAAGGPKVKPAGAAAPAGNPDEKVLIIRDGQKGRISRKFLKPTDQIVQ